MDRVVAMLILLGVLVSLVLMILALFAVAPVVCSCLLSLVYTLYLFMAYEESGVHHAQEFENRFWTIFALLCSTALFFAQDSPVGFGRYNPSLGFVGVVLSSYAMHLWDRYMHRVAISRQTQLRRSISLTHRLRDLGVPVEDQLRKINDCLRDIDQLLIPSTINNFINQRFVLRKEREIISVFMECDAVALNYLISHVKLGLLIYKIKDHRNFAGQHRTELIQLLAVDRLPALTVMSRVIVLHALQMLKLRANPRAEYWVRDIILNTHQDDLSEIKTLTDAKGDYFCMNKLIFDDIRSESVRQDILSHIRREGAVQQAHMQMGTKRGQQRRHMAWRKVLSDVDDTLFCSGGSYPAGIDKRFPKKVVYPGVLAFYRELDLGIHGPEEWPENRVGNLVFLSARPHLYKDVSEKTNFAKFEKLRKLGEDGRMGMHTVPSLLAGDIASGSHFIATNDCEPLSRKKFENFKRYVSIYPEYQHVFVCDNGQGDVRAGEMMFDSFPYEFEALYVHVVQDIPKTYGYAKERWRAKEFSPCFFRTYPEAALHAASQNPPLIRITGLRRVCQDAVNDFYQISSKLWTSWKQKRERRAELNQSICCANLFLKANGVQPVELVKAEQYWKDGAKVRTPYGRGVVRGFDPEFDMYEIELDWRPLDVQIDEHLRTVKDEAIRPKSNQKMKRRASAPLETVLEDDEATDDDLERVDTNKPLRTRPKLPAHTVSLPEHEFNKFLDETTTSNTENAIFDDIESAVPEAKDFSVLSDDSATYSDSTSVNSDGKSEDSKATEEDSKAGEVDTEAGEEDTFNIKVTARINSRFVSKYMPPHLPKISKKSAPLFSFWTGSNPETPKVAPILIKDGDKCSTQYGLATVVEFRANDRVVVVDMLGWTARAYLRVEDVKVVSKGILASLFGRQTSTSDSSLKPLDFPYAKGTIIQTPFGEATVFRPLPRSIKNESLRIDLARRPSLFESPTIGMSLTSWRLSDDSHPKLYTTVETAQLWKNRKLEDPKNSSDGLLSAIKTLVSSTRDFAAGRFGGSQPQKVQKEEESPPKFVQRYKDAAAVSTLFGNGMVRGFREKDGFYNVSLLSWRLANGVHPTALLREVDISYRIAKGCLEGYPVLTSLGLTGILEAVEPTTGVHFVFVPSTAMAMYLQPEAVIRPLKAAVGEDVLSAYGDGTVERYDIERDVYKIKLSGWNATLYAKAEMFDRVGDSMRDRDGPFGMNWLVHFFFSSSESKNEGTRSRSNSIVSVGGLSVRSLSARSQSARSVS